MIDAAFISEALKIHHNGIPGNSEVYFPELKVGTGYGHGDAQQSLDGFAMSLWPSSGYVKTVYEIKISRSDFIVEIKKPMKRRRGLLYSNYFYFVAPMGMLKVNEIPIECGLMEVDEKQECHRPLKAPYREYARPTWGFIASICRRVSIDSATKAGGK